MTSGQFVFLEMEERAMKIHWGWWKCVVLLVVCSPAMAREEDAPRDASEPAVIDLEDARQEVAEKYSAAHPEVQEYILWTARSFGPSGLWLNAEAYASLTPEAREKKVVYLAALLEDGEYGRHLCQGLAQAGAIVDARLVPGLIKVAGYHQEGVDYDCRPKWMAVAALARQESDDAVPTLIELVDHGNQNTRMWARAALARKAGSGGKDFKDDKAAWKQWWEERLAPAPDHSS